VWQQISLLIKQFAYVFVVVLVNICLEPSIVRSCGLPICQINLETLCLAVAVVLGIIFNLKVGDLDALSQDSQSQKSSRRTITHTHS